MSTKQMKPSLESSHVPLRGVYPILATCFDQHDAIDYDSQTNLIEFCIQQGVHGLVLLANASEGHLLTDEEKYKLISFCLKQINGRVPVIVTVNHNSSKAALELAQFAEQEGASAIMSLPPFFGRWRSGLDEIFQYFKTLNDGLEIPIVIQDHVLSDIQMPVSFLVDLGKKLNRVRYIKLEQGNIIHKAWMIQQRDDNPFDGIFGGNSGIFLPEEMEAGCTGTMPACYMPEVYRKTWDLVEAGKEKEAMQYFIPYSHLAAYEKDVANRCVWKEILVRRQVIAHNVTRGPKPVFACEFQLNQLIQVAKYAGLVE